MAERLKRIFDPGNDQIDDTYIIEAWHVSQSVDAFTGAEEYEIQLSGSFAMTGSITHDGLDQVTTETVKYVVRDEATKRYMLSTSGGVGNDGSSGTSGTTGAAGSSGTCGETGSPGDPGSSGTSGTTGAAGSSGTSGTGTSGTSGGAGTSGTSGVGGGGASVSKIYNNVIRYEYEDGGYRVQMLSSANIYREISWTRSGTTLTIASTNHGLEDDDYVVIRNMSEDYSYLQITVTTANQFTVQVANSGATSGTAGEYIPAFQVTAIDDNILTIKEPGSASGEPSAQLISFSWYLPLSNSEVKVLTLPNDALQNGAGGNSSLDTRVPPDIRAYDVDSSNSSWITTTTSRFSTIANHNEYDITGGLSTFTPIIITAQF